MPAINRRRLLRGIVAASAALALAGGSVALAATHEAAVAMTTHRERFAFHLAEMKKAGRDIDPRVRFDEIYEHFGRRDDGLALMLMPKLASGGAYDATESIPGAART